jgi:hypothetical protein
MAHMKAQETSRGDLAEHDPGPRALRRNIAVRTEANKEVTIGELMCINWPRTPAPAKSVVAQAGKLAMVFTGHGAVTADARGSRVKCSAM